MHACEEADRLYAIMRDVLRRAASQAMLRQIVPWTDDLRPDWPRIEAITSDYANVEIPCLILWGARDEALPVSMDVKQRKVLPKGCRTECIMACP